MEVQSYYEVARSLRLVKACEVTGAHIGVCLVVTGSDLVIK